MRAIFQQCFSAPALRSYVAESISTFFFVFIAVGSAICARSSYLQHFFFYFSTKKRCAWFLNPSSSFLTGMLNPDVTSDASSLIATAIAQGFALFVAVFMAFDVSGGHVNPAVTFAFALGGHISVPVAIFYWISQMVAATLACLLLRVASAGQVRTTSFLYNTCFPSKSCELLQ